MADETLATSSWYVRQIRIAFNALRSDLKPILILTVALGIFGAASGKLTNTTASSAQLLLTPMPLRASLSDQSEDEFAKMIAEPMDVKTASLLCMSDEVLSRTREKLDAQPEFEAFKSLQQLKNSLAFTVTIAKDTPYETSYSPILRLSAKAGAPARAKLMVDTWADACVEMSVHFKMRQQDQTVEALRAQSMVLAATVAAAESALETFRRENNLEHLTTRMTGIIQVTTLYLETRGRTEEEYSEEAARFEALRAAGAAQGPTQELRLRPSDPLLKLLKGDGDGDAAGPKNNLLTLEVLDPLYELALTAEADAAGKKARLDKMDAILKKYGEELRALQAEHARVATLDKELLREVDLVEEAYLDAGLKLKYAEVAAQMKQKELQVLSYGAEWRLPRFRRALLFGASSALTGVLAGIGLSLLARLVILPALEPGA